MDKSEIAKGLIKSINEGIDKYQKIIKSNQEKETRGLQKLSKQVGQNDPALTGAGTELDAGTANVAVPNLTKKDLKKFGPLPGVGSGGGFDGSNLSSPNNTDGFKASEKPMDKSEIPGNSLSCPGCGSTSIITLGTLGNTDHLLCSGCGSVGTTIRQENDEAIANGNINNVAKAELKKDEKSRQVRGTPASQVKSNVVSKVRGTPAEQVKETVAKVGKSNIIPFRKLNKVTPPSVSEETAHKLKDEYGHDKEGKAKAYATMWKIHNQMNKSSGVLPDGSGFFTATVKTKKDLKKEELTTKKAPMTATVEPEKVTGSKDVEEVPSPIVTDGSGKIIKGKSLKKGAMVDYIKARAAAAGVNPEKVLGKPIPPPLPKVTLTPTPSFNKGESPAAKPIAKSPASGQPSTAPSTPTAQPTKTVSKL